MAENPKKTVLETPDRNEALIYDSPHSEPDDDFWLAHGVKILEDSMPSLRNSASELIKSIGMLITVYLAILGFAKSPESMNVYNKTLFSLPIIPWVIGTYCCLRVVKPKVTEINLHSPTDIKETAIELLKTKQRYLECAFALLSLGIVLAFIMVAFRI